MKLLKKYSALTATSFLFATSLFAATPAVHVDVYSVPKPENIPVTLEYPAQLRAVKSVTITAQVSGILKQKFYKEGVHVKKGECLYQIDPALYQAEVANAKATLDLQIAKLAQAKKNWERASGLFKDNAISVQDKDNAFYDYKSAKASVEVAKASLQKALVNLDYTDVNATVSGMVGMKMVDVGDYVKVGTSLVQITRENPIYAEFSIPNISKMRTKYSIKNGSWENLQNSHLQAALIINGKQYKTVGDIDFADTHVNEATSTLKLRAVFKNNDHMLLPGEFATVKLLGVISHNVVTVPQQSVLQNPLGTIVFVVAHGVVGIRPVKILDTSGQNFIVNGVQSGDQVIINNFFRIKPGMPVKIDKTINR